MALHPYRRTVDSVDRLVKGNLFQLIAGCLLGKLLNFYETATWLGDVFHFYETATWGNG